MSDEPISETEMQLALTVRLLAKAIHRLQRFGAKRDSEQLIAEAKTIGIDIQIMPDPTIENN